jgi:hypothetical protein
MPNGCRNHPRPARRWRASVAILFALPIATLHAQTLSPDPVLTETDLLAPAPPPRQDIRKLRLAVWNVSHLTTEEAAELARANRPERTVWRNTFGAERRTATWQRHGRAGIDADIIALQGISTVKDVRRMFPARKFHVVFSRSALMNLDSSFGSRQDDSNGLTAIAIRRRPGLRMAGQRHFVAPRLGSTALQATAPGLAIRVNPGAGQFIWVANIALNPDCHTATTPTPECDGERLAKASIDAWFDTARRSGTPVVLAGSAAALIGSNVGRNERPPATSACTHSPPGLTIIEAPGRGAASPDAVAAQSRGSDPRWRLQRLAPPDKRPCAALARLALE